jgi:hypothetical protein
MPCHAHVHAHAVGQVSAGPDSVQLPAPLHGSACRSHLCGKLGNRDS